MGSAIPIKMPPQRNCPQERFRIQRRILLSTTVHSVPARSCPIFSGVFSDKTRRMHIQYQRYPTGVAHAIFKVRCNFVRNRGISLSTTVHSVPARSCPIFSGVFSDKTRRMHIQYQRYPTGVAHAIFKVRCNFVRNRGISSVIP